MLHYKFVILLIHQCANSIVNRLRGFYFQLYIPLANGGMCTSTVMYSSTKSKTLDITWKLFKYFKFLIHIITY